MWREFSFALHQIQQAIQPRLAMENVMFQWQQIASALTERSRHRKPQLLS